VDSFAQALSNILIEYGERRTNPVLDVLPVDSPFRQNEKYPAERLAFGEGRWRAYYHSHVSEPPAMWQEHGHFHLFYCVDDTGEIARDWSHVAALSLNSQGQPVRWFAVNNWVCGDRWIAATELINTLQYSVEGNLPVERWLACMSGFYQNQIEAMLIRRDQLLDQKRSQGSGSKAQLDRTIYYLGDQAIDLKRELIIAMGDPDGAK